MNYKINDRGWKGVMIVGKVVVKPSPKQTYEELLPKQQAFVDYYIETMNATEAARRAGYKRPFRQGFDLVRSLGHIIKKYMDEKKNERIASSEEVLEFLTRVIKKEEKDAFGLDTSNQDAIKAAELLGKRYSLFTDKLKMEGEMEINVSLVEDEESLEDESGDE